MQVKEKGAVKIELRPHSHRFWVPLKNKVLGNLERLVYISKELSGNNENTLYGGSHSMYIKMRVKYNLET